MSETTKIQWADATWNSWIGCAKVSAGCKNCYAENTTRARVLRSQGKETWGKGAQRSRTSAAYWKQPAKWNSDAGYAAMNHSDETNLGKDLGEYIRPRIFPSLCDWLDDEVPIEWLADFLRVIRETPNLDWLLLTKRPQNFESRITAAYQSDNWTGSSWPMGWVKGISTDIPKNVWIGTSVEDQANADKRIPELLRIPAKVSFLSAEPLLGPVDLRLRNAMPGKIDWVIIGGESGPGARPCNVEWIRSIVTQCKAAAVACFVKQLGTNPQAFYTPQGETVEEAIDQLKFNDKKGGDPSEWPTDLCVREFPL